MRYRSPWKTFSLVPYSWTRVYVGLVTSSSSATCRPATMPLVSVVLPLPNSPVSRINTGACNFFASFRPQAIVSSAEYVITSSVTPLQLLQQFAPCEGNRLCHFARQNPGSIRLFAQQISGSPMHANSQGYDAN